MDKSYSEVRSRLLSLLRAGLPVMIHGQPGVGKSTLVRDVAQEMGLPVEALFLSTYQPPDVTGLPFRGQASIDAPTTEEPRKRGRPRKIKGQECTKLLPNDWALRAASRPSIIFLDELTNAPALVQAAAMRLVLEKEVGSLKLHPDTLFVAAGNDGDSAAVGGTLAAPLSNRMAHLWMGIDVAAWRQYIIRKYGDSPIADYFCANTDLAHLCLVPTSREGRSKPFPSPRAWENVARWMKLNDYTAEALFSSKRRPGHVVKSLIVDIVACLVGESEGTNFANWLNIRTMPPATELLRDVSWLNEQDSDAVSIGMMAKVALGYMAAGIAAGQGLPPANLVENAMRIMARAGNGSTAPYGEWLSSVFAIHLLYKEA